MGLFFPFLAVTHDKIYKSVGLSNILDDELVRGKPVEGSHGEVVGTAVMDGELLGEVVQGIKAVAGIEVLLALPVAALHFPVVAGV